MVRELSLVDAGADDLVVRCQRGEQAAFSELFAAYKDKIYSIALRYTGDPAAAMDIGQDVFLKLLSKVGDFRGEARFDTWVYRLVANCCLDHRRKGVRWVPFLSSMLERLPGRPSALDALVRSEVENRVQQAVAKLPAEQKIVVVLRYTEGLAYEEIAGILGCSEGTVASRLNRAHKTLERRLGAYKRDTNG